MPPIQLNRRRFLGCSAAASLALSQGNLAEAAAIDGETHPVRLGLVGIGNRGTALLRSLLECPAPRSWPYATPSGSIASEAKESSKRRGAAPESFIDPRNVFDRDDVDAVVVALPCDAHDQVYADALAAGKHLFAEKPLAITLDGCDRLIAARSELREPDRSRRLPASLESALSPGDRADRPRRAGAARRGPCELDQQQRADHRPRRMAGPSRALRRLDGRAGGAHLGRLALAQGRTARKGNRLGTPRPLRVRRQAAERHRPLFGRPGVGRRFPGLLRPKLDRPRRRGVHRLVAPRAGRAGGLRLHVGALTFRDRNSPSRTIAPGPQPDTRLALEAFLTSVRSTSPLPPPLSLEDARAATRVGLLVRKAIEENRTVQIGEISA